MLAQRERAPAHADRRRHRQPHAAGILLYVCLGDNLLAEAFTSRRHRVPQHVCLPVLPLPSWSVQLPSGEDPAFELFAAGVVVLACVLVGVMMSPWAVRHANHLDLTVHTGLLLILFLAALQTHLVEEMVIGKLLVVVFSAIMCAFLGAMAWGLHLFTLRLKKPFHFFLCHHKIGGGAFCRLLEMRLVNHGHVARGVFLDSDNLQDLSLVRRRRRSWYSAPERSF